MICAGLLIISVTMQAAIWWHATYDDGAYACLIAAAPDLLTALELWQSTLEILDVDEGFHTIYVPSETVDAMAAAIAKARGIEPDHDPPDSRNPYTKPYDEALIGHLRNNPPRNE